MFGMYACSFSLGAYLIRKDIRSADEIMKTFFALACAAIGIGQSSTVAPDSSKFSAAAVSIFELLDNPSLIPPDAPGIEGKIHGDIALKNVDFTYPCRPDIKVLKSVSMKIGQGKSVAIVGGSGCGKSTIIRLLERFYDSSAGEVVLDGINSTKYAVSHLRKHMALVEQEPVLFTGTVRENIRFGLADATDDMVVSAAKEANAHDFIMKLPSGYETMLGTSYVQLSGGQKQRVAIARALIRNPKILLLDEATSALDSESEAIIMEVLKEATKNRTTISIAHRLATIQHADIIYVMDNGCVIEQGSHEQLVGQKHGIYKKLAGQQSLKAIGF